MSVLMAVTIGFLFAASIYLMLRRSLVKLVMGLILLSNAANLVIFSASGLTRAAPPLIEEGSKAVTSPVADPLTQALILTAIVIAFGVLAFSVVLIHKAISVVGSDDSHQMQEHDE